jgi:hypothetical protein
MRGFDIIFDDENRRIGLWSDDPDRIIDNGKPHHRISNTLRDILIALAAVALIVIVSSAICISCRRKRAKRAAKESTGYSNLPDYAINQEEHDSD